MCIVEGQIETLRKLKDALKAEGITRFSSIGDIDRFKKYFEFEKKQLEVRTQRSFDAETREMGEILHGEQCKFAELKMNVHNEVKGEVSRLEDEVKQLGETGSLNPILRFFRKFKIRRLVRRKDRIEGDIDGIVQKKIHSAETRVTRLRRELDNRIQGRKKLLAGRCRKPLADLNRTKEVVDGLYPLIAGAIGENAVMNEVRGLPDDHYLINDFSMRFNPPIYNKKEGDRIQSIQIDHLLVCPSGIFILETKNWSKSSIRSMDLRSPVQQVLRTNFALFVVLNSDRRDESVQLSWHKWGETKIPVRNVVVMINEKPNREFKHVKVLSLNKLIDHIKYFDRIFSDEEVRSIFEFLRARNLYEGR